MDVLMGCLILSIVYRASYTYVLFDDDAPSVAITWPSEYYFKGQTIDIRTGVVHPFRMWYSSEYNRSRLELYDGEINTYSVAGTDEERGGEYKVVTVTTHDLTNTEECLYTSTESEQSDFLPQTDEMTNTQSYTFNGRVVNEWKRQLEEDGVWRMEDILMVYRTEYGIDVPVTFEQKKYDLAAGRLLDHTIQEFYDFKPSVSSEDLYNFDEEDCEMIGSDFTKNIKFLHPTSDIELAFDGYKNHHKKLYKKTELELRKALFHKNWRLVVDHNRKNLGYKLALNKFADRTDEELQFLAGTRPSDPGIKGTHAFHTLDEVDELVNQLPDEFDLRLQGAMRPVKQQGSCGSCWAFTLAATVEGAVSYGLGGRDVDLSEQSLVDCAWGYENLGCMGGSLGDAFKYVLDHGIPADVDYGQYKEEDGKCHIQNLTSVFKIRGFGKVNPNSVNSVKLALIKFGPVAVSLRATYNMKLYSSGVFYDDNCVDGQANHGVVIVGYGHRHGDLYWIVRNSWGEDWGEDGYILMAAQGNNCFILNEPFYAIV